MAVGSVHKGIQMPENDYWFGFRVLNEDNVTMYPGMSCRLSLGATDIRVVQTTNSGTEGTILTGGMVLNTIAPNASGIVIFEGFVTNLSMATATSVIGTFIAASHETFSATATNRWTIQSTTTAIWNAAAILLSESTTSSKKVKAFLTMKRK